MVHLTSIVDLFAVLLFIATIRAIRDHRRRGGLPYPPGPRPFPIIGNLLDIPKEFSWLAYTQFSKKHGMTLSLVQVLSDRNGRGYTVLSCFGAGYHRIEHCQSRQGSP
jgi:hypothetical protein